MMFFIMFFIIVGEKPVGKSKENREPEFVPNWSNALPATHSEVPKKRQKSDWDDSALDQMMMEYSEAQN